jgi:hypothetical protein
MRVPALPLIVAGVAVLAVGGFALFAWRKGGIAAAASSVGSAAVTAAGGAVSGAVGAVGASVGLPTPDQTVTDAASVRWLIDTYGYLDASKWAGAPALFSAIGMKSGTGTPLPDTHPAVQALGAQVATSAPTQAAQLAPSAYAAPSWSSFSDQVAHDPYAPWSMTP